MAGNFVHLHNHTEYSLLDGAQKISELIARAKEFGMPAVSMTDHGNLFGAIKFYRQATSAGIKPILGCEVYVAPKSRFDKFQGQGRGKPYHHLVLLAENSQGFKNLVHLTSLGYTEGFYYRPRVDKELLREYHEGLIALTACLAGEVPSALRADDMEGARSSALEHLEIFGEGNFFLELQDHGIAEQAQVNEGLVELSAATGIPLIVTNDCHFLRQEDHGAHDVLICIGMGRKRGEETRTVYSTDHFFKSAEQMAERFPWCPDALENTVRIAERCEVEIELGELHLPSFPVEPGETLDSAFIKETRAGFERRRPKWEKLAAEKRLLHSLEDYEKRLQTELDVIIKMNFPGYFLITGDFIQHARRVGIPVGPGRGSAAGSLVAYCLEITDIDPLQYDLLFERFLNPERVSMPDIDIDFCYRRRQEVIDYVTEKYGRENVAQIITFGTMAAKAAIRDTGRVLDMPYNEVDRIAKLVPEEIGTKLGAAIDDVPALAKLYNEDPQIHELLDIALRLEGLSRHASTHAAGVVITPRPVVEFAPLFKSSKNEITTQWAKDEVEEAGLLKMDFLGLKTLTLITDTLASITASGLEVPDLNELPLDDPKTFELFCAGETTGVFQFESSGMRDILRRLGPEKFEDLIALNALYRPGPLRSGMIDRFIERRRGKVEVDYPHPRTREILEETYGVIVYQEQVMQIASRLAGFTLGAADLLRRAMGKKKVSVMDEQKLLFLAGAKEKGISESDATAIFELMAHFAGYGFNKSHSAAYAFVAYQTAYLKAHFRVHFLSALLTSEKDHTDKLVEYISDCRDTGIEILGPDINHSERYFTVEGDAIRFGLAAIKGVGEAAVDRMLEARHKQGRFASLDEFCAEVDRKAINRKVLEALVKSGAFDIYGSRASVTGGLESAMERGARAAEDRERGQAGLFGEGAGAMPEAPPLPDLPDWSARETLAGEKESLGFYISGHPLDAHKEIIDEVTSHRIHDAVSGAVRLGGLVTALRRKRTKAGKWMATFVLEDASGHIECVVFPQLYAEIGEGLEEEQAVVVAGRVESREGDANVLVESTTPLAQAKRRPIDGLTIRLDADAVSDGTLSRVRTLFDECPGSVPVFFILDKAQRYQLILQAESPRNVKADRELVGAINRILGDGCARLGRPDRV